MIWSINPLPFSVCVAYLALVLHFSGTSYLSLVLGR